MKEFFKWIKELLWKERSTDKSRGLTITTMLMFLGVIVIFVATASMGDSKVYLANLGLALMVASASALSGAFMGFLFGIPRSLQRSQSTTTNNSSEANGSSVADNTNLEQISDWLTKIIVGVSLTQIHEISQKFTTLSWQITAGFTCDPDMGVSFTSACIIFYTICGFIFSYLWTRINLKDALNGDYEKLKDLTEKNRKRLEEIDKIRFEKARVNMRNDESQFPYIANIAKPLAPTEADDPQKGRWGGKPEDNGRKLSVTVSPHSKDLIFDVELKVESTDPSKPLTGMVLFLMHDSFARTVEPKEVKDGVAIHSFQSYEAFTVGVVCDEGQTKLELDINQDPNVPAGYKY